MLAIKIGKINIPREIISSITIKRKHSIQEKLEATFGTIQIIAASMNHHEIFQELFILRKSYNDTIVRQVAIGAHLIDHKFKFTSTAHRAMIGESAKEIMIKLESIE